ncbi:MAG: ACP S-malonyltransferase [Desulfobacterota bacterium]|nr:ACP S-malonyltransferase [Thermodesulfobacteriota bacterium]
MKRIGLLFPGQGSQYVGMGKALYDSDETVRAIFERAEEVLNFPIKSLCFDGPEEELKKTYNTQPAILLVSYAVWTKLKKETGLIPHMVSGHSLGEYTALLVSGFFSFEDALLITRKRGLLMENAYPHGQGGMVALLGPDMGLLESFLSRYSTEEKIVTVANLNSPDQVVISGDLESLKKVVEELKGTGYKKAVFLNVSGPFHSPLMRNAAEKLLEELKKIENHPLNFPVVFNCDATISKNKDEVCEKLFYQMFSPVRWEECVRKMVDASCEIFLEVGPRNVLTNLVKRIVPHVPCYPVETEKDIEKVKEILG